MYTEGAGKCLDGGEEPLLQAGDQQGGDRLLPLGLALKPFLAQLPVLVEENRKPQFGGVGRQAVDVDLFHVSLRETALHLADVLLEPPDHHVIEQLLAFHRDAPTEPLRVEDLQQGGEAVGMTVVRRGGQEQSVLEPRGQVTDGAGDFRVDGIPRAAGRRGVVCLVEDEQRSGPEIAEPVTQRPGVGFIDQQAVRDKEARMRGPGVGAVAAFPADADNVVLVQHLEHQAETLFQFVLPLREHRWRAGDDDVADLLAQQQFAGDEGRLDGLAETDIIGDEHVDARQQQGLAERLDLVGIDLDASPIGRLEQGAGWSPSRSSSGACADKPRRDAGGQSRARPDGPTRCRVGPLHPIPLPTGSPAPVPAHRHRGRRGEREWHRLLLEGRRSLRRDTAVDGRGRSVRAFRGVDSSLDLGRSAGRCGHTGGR